MALDTIVTSQSLAPTLRYCVCLVLSAVLRTCALSLGVQEITPECPDSEIAQSLGIAQSRPVVSFETQGVQATTAVQADLLVWNAGGKDPRFWASRTQSDSESLMLVKKARFFLPPALLAPLYFETRVQVSWV